MKFDKETAVVVLVCIVLITVWHIYSSKAEQNPQLPASVPAEQTVPAQSAETPAAPAAPAAQTAQPPASLPPASAAAKPAASIKNSAAEFFFDTNGILNEIIINDVKRTNTEDPIMFRESAGYEPFTCTIPDWTYQSAKVTKESESVLTVIQIFRKEKEELTVKKVFTVTPDSPALQCAVSFSGSARQLPKVVIWSGTISPLKHFSNDDLRDVHQAEFMLSGNGDVITADPAVKKQEKYFNQKTSQSVKWVAVSNKYFLSQLYAASHPFNGGCDLSNQMTNGYAEPGIAGIYLNVAVPSEFKFNFYAGTKEIAQISKLPADATEAIHLAYWSWLEPLCRPMLALLNLLKGITGSYGWAIILLTILVKLVLWPLIHKGNKSMRRMSKVQPLIKELKEKYKDNPQMFNQKMMELYKQEKVNPMGGCLPMLLQFPVFVALYSTLEAAVELRHVPFLWAADLSRPDVIGPEIFGFSLHPLILISTGLMVLQMKRSPQTGDPMQRKMMMFMPLIMLIFFYNFPSGLALYWTVNNVLSILQMKFSQYAARKEDEREKSSEKNGSAKAA